MDSLLNLILATSVNAWGSEGHAIVGSIAQNFLDSNAQSYVSKILASNGDMAAVSSWADSYKFTTAGAFSKPLHYVDIKDAPPTTCGFDESRDCPNGGCINTAIQTYTNQLCDASTNLDALRFLIHFFGDITQPLHNSNRDVGGNSDKINYKGANTNLHHIWDTEMVQDRIAQNSDQATYVNNLISSITSGSYASQAASWISQHSYNAGSQYGNNLASIDYSIDSDTYGCSYVWSNYDANPSQDFSGSYFSGAASIIDVQLAKGGYRLAQHLNAAFAGCSGSTPVVPTPTGTPSGPTATPTTPVTPPPSSCAHDKCSIGGALSQGCNACVDQIISADSYCSTSQWDQTCVDEVQSVCGLSDCQAPSTPPTVVTTGCKHDICVTGAFLKKGCNACADQVIASDSYCGKKSWNSRCVSEVASVCGISC
ncbi:hypothetical protein HDV04_006086 [Boothiomyces sp. JEL0838]|nr:hypothetical protein HDV04_006086 [Boothiomyces sp. JEL0838]